jgi:mannitol-1-phosphate 5-dehydrogenase
MAEPELAEHIDCLLRHRFANAALADRVERVAREPLRKLAPQERLIGLLRKLEKHRLSLQPVCRTVAAALGYYDPNDEESRRLQELVRHEGAGSVLTQICHLTPDEEGYRLCLAEWIALNNSQELR